jgi:hypothetical protein
MNRRKIHSVMIVLAMSAVLILSVQASADKDMPLNFETISSVSLAGAATGMAVSGSFAYVPAGEAGLYVVDVSDPANGRVASVVDTPGAATAVAIAANYAYLADEAGGLQVVDIADPAAATIVGALEGEAKYVMVAVAGSYAYVAASPGQLHVIDISSPREPKELSSYTVSNIKSICGLAAQFPYVFLAFGYSGLFGGPDAAKAELSIIDVSDPLSPRQVGSLRTRHIGRDAAFSGRYAYLACADSGGSGLEIIDVSDPPMPGSVGYVSFPQLPQEYLRMELRGESAFIAGGKLLVVDVSDPSLPHLTGSMHPRASAVDFAFSGELAYVALKESRCQKCPRASVFQTWQPSDKIMLPVSRVEAEAEPVTHAVEVRYLNTSSAAALSGHFLCAAIGSAQGSKLQVIDLSNSKYPPTSGECVLDGEAKDIAIWENFALVAADGLMFVDISDAVKPAVVKTVDAIKRAYAVEVLESYAYVVDGIGLKVIELKPPAEAAIVGTLQTPYSARDVAVSKNFAYIADGAGLQIVDITDKRSPKPAGSFSYEWAMATRIAAEGSLVYLGDKAGFITSIDVKDPYNPKLRQKKQLPGSPGAMSISGGRLFVPVSADKILMQSLDITQPANTPSRKIRDFVTAMTNRGAVPSPQALEVSESWGREESVFKGGAVAVSDSTIYVTDLEQGLLTGPLKASVPEGASIKVEPKELTGSYELRMDTPPLHFEIANVGVGGVKYTVSSDADWLMFNPWTGDLQENERRQIEVPLVPSALREGTNTAKIIVAEEYGRLLQVIPLSLQVLPCRYPPIHFQPNWHHLKDVKPGQVEKVILSSEKPFKVFQASASYPWIQVEIDSQESSLQHTLTITITERGKPGRNYGVFKIQTDNPIYENFSQSFCITFSE